MPVCCQASRRAGAVVFLNRSQIPNSHLAEAEFFQHKVHIVRRAIIEITHGGMAAAAAAVAAERRRERRRLSSEITLSGGADQGLCSP